MPKQILLADSGTQAVDLLCRFLLEPGDTVLVDDPCYFNFRALLRAKLAGAMGMASARLRAVGLMPWVMPRAGMYLWCELPEGLDAAEIARRALEEGIVLAPGNVFSPAQTAERFLRFNVAQCADPRIFKTLASIVNRSARGAALPAAPQP